MISHKRAALGLFLLALFGLGAPAMAHGDSGDRDGTPTGPKRGPGANWIAPRWREGFDESIRPVRTSPRHTLNKDSEVQVRALAQDCEDGICIQAVQCFQGFERISCRCDSRIMDNWEDQQAAGRLRGLLASIHDPPEEGVELLRGTQAALVRASFPHCPLKRAQELSILMDGRFAGVAKVVEIVPRLSSIENFGPVVSLAFRVLLTPHPWKKEELNPVLESKAYQRLRFDNLGTGLDRHLVELSEPELVSLEEEVLLATAPYDPTPTQQNIALEDQRRLCQAVPVREKSDSHAWTLLVKIAYGRDCEAPTAGLFAVLRQGEKLLDVLVSVPAEEAGDFPLWRLSEVVDLGGDGQPDVLVGSPNLDAPIQQGFGAFINTGPSKWRYEAWRLGQDG